MARLVLAMPGPSASFGKHRESFPHHDHESADLCHGVTEALAPWHLFIPSFASGLAMEGVDLLTIKELGGWKNWQ